MLARNQINATIDHRSFADQGITEQPTIHEGYIAQNMEKKGMIADRCEINRQIRADNKMLRELKAKVAKLAEAVEKSIPIIAETLEAIRNHMIFTQYHLLHNEMQKEVIHDWMNHFNPILNKYNTVKKKLKAKVTERKELNVEKEKTSILNPIQHIKLNQQLTTVTEEIEELKSRKEQLIFQAQCSTIGTNSFFPICLVRNTGIVRRKNTNGQQILFIIIHPRSYIKNTSLKSTGHRS